MVVTELLTIVLLVPLPFVMIWLENRRMMKVIAERERSRRLAVALQDLLARDNQSTRTVALDELWRYWADEFDHV